MAVQSLAEILAPAFDQRYGVPAINIVNDLTMENVLAGAVEAGSPIILQTSVKTVRSIGVNTLFQMWKAMTAGIEVPCALHLDHCPDRQVISDCLAAGWNSVLFDASQLPVEENQRQTVEVVAEARRYGADVEGEIESITGQEDGVGSDDESRRQTLDGATALPRGNRTWTSSRRRSATLTAPTSAPRSSTSSGSPTSSQRIPVPIALHGGSGLTDDQFHDCIGRGCAKVNISTALKETYMQSNLAFLQARPRRRTSGIRRRCSAHVGGGRPRDDEVYYAERLRQRWQGLTCLP